MGVRMVTRRVAAIALSVVLTSGGAGLCAGWAATPEARMACCAKGGDCPMHRSAHGSDLPTVVSQVDADTCCAASERDPSTPSPTFVPLASLALVVAPVPVVVPSTHVPPVAWHAPVPRASNQVSRHLLLSVFLV